MNKYILLLMIASLLLCRCEQSHDRDSNDLVLQAQLDACKEENDSLRKISGDGADLSVEGYHVSYPPKEIADIVNAAWQRKSPEKEISGTDSLVASDFAEAELAALNKYATSVAKTDCKIRVIYGCGSCTIGICHPKTDHERWGNETHTDCGVFCWYCAYVYC